MEFENLIKLIEAVSDSSLTGFKYEDDNIRLSLKKEKARLTTGGAAVTVPAEAVQAAVAERDAIPAAEGDTEAVHVSSQVEKKEGCLVKSPLVGTFYAAPSEDADPFVAVGDQVSKGQVVAIVEAMKLMNDIESDFAGIVAEVLVENGELVEYGQPLFRIV